MREAIDVHKLRERYDKAVLCLKNDKKVSDVDRKLIVKFTWDLQAEGVRLSRLTKYIYLLKQLSDWLPKDFNKATIKDIKQVMAEINQSDYSEWTKNDYGIALKRFYRWLHHLPRDKDPAETEWIHIGSPKNGILPEELLTEEEVLKLVNSADNSRDRAFVLCLYETGGRIGELLNLRRKHVSFDQYGAALLLSGKTGDRRARIIVASSSLSQWMNDHPHKEPDSPLWVIVGDMHHGEVLDYDAARKVLQRLAKRANVKKRVNPHSFRHARSTHLANSLTEAQMKKYLGWTPGSKMAAVYVHLSGADVDDALLRLNGIQVAEADKKSLKLKVLFCPRCTEKNLPTTKFCGRCAMPLNVETALEVEQQRTEADDWMNKLLEDPEVKSFLREKLRKLVGTEQVKAPGAAPT